jgi:hypothetical protein
MPLFFNTLVSSLFFSQAVQTLGSIAVFVLSMLSSNQRIQIKTYRRFAAVDGSEELVTVFDKNHLPSVLGEMHLFNFSASKIEILTPYSPSFRSVLFL